jgi:hypothetical protein
VLVGDVQALDAEVEHDDADDQADRGVAEAVEHPERDAHEERGESGRGRAVAVVGGPANEGRRPRAGDSGEPEQAEHGVAVVKRSGAQQERQRRPERREAAAGERAEHHPLAQHGLGPYQRQHRAEDLAVAQQGGRRYPRKRAVQDRGQDEHQPGGGQERHPPAERAGEDAADRRRARPPAARRLSGGRGAHRADVSRARQPPENALNERWLL